MSVNFDLVLQTAINLAIGVVEGVELEFLPGPWSPVDVAETGHRVVFASWRWVHIGSPNGRNELIRALLEELKEYVRSKDLLRSNVVSLQAICLISIPTTLRMQVHILTVFTSQRIWLDAI